MSVQISTSTDQPNQSDLLIGNFYGFYGSKLLGLFMVIYSDQIHPILLLWLEYIAVIFEGTQIRRNSVVDGNELYNN